MNSTICTLFEGDYHLGAAALINSLHRGGFAGTFVCGYRGPRPAWAEVAVPGIVIKWVQLGAGVHLTNHKPAFLETCLDVHTPEAEQVFYADPDIVVKAPWAVLRRWAADGVALVEDVNGYLPERHPYRLAWGDFLAVNGLAARRGLTRYYNAGFIGFPRGERSFLAEWRRLLDLAAGLPGGLERLKNGAPHDLFHSADQDALNMALALGDWPINGAGPEGMDFIPGGHLLSHAAGGRKPWRRGALRLALRGRPPGRAQKCFFEYTDGPLAAFEPGVLRSLRRESRLAALIGRFYRRG